MSRSTFFFYMVLLTNDGGPSLSLGFQDHNPYGGPPVGLDRFQATIGWLKNGNFGMISGNAQGPLANCWVIIR